MARIPENEIETLKREVSIQRLAESKGVILRQRGEELMGLCPFHDDHSPSLVINPAKNLWHCLGACQAGGSVIDWVMYSESCTFPQAVQILQNDFSSLAAESPVVVAPERIEQKMPAQRDSEESAQLENVVTLYSAALMKSVDALAYLQKRGIYTPEAIERFRLGYSNRSLGIHLPEKGSAEGTAIRNQLQDVGIYRSSGHEHFAGSLVIPIINEEGEITEMYGRKIGGRLRKGTPLHLYLPGPHRGVWNIVALEKSKEIILCESLIDALTFWCAGFRNVTTSYGIEGFTKDHLDAFKRYGTERVYIAYDRDDAGEKASSSLAAQLNAEGIECKRVQFPNGMDANEYALQVRPAKKSLGLVIEKSVPIGQIERATKEEKNKEDNGASDNPPSCETEASPQDKIENGEVKIELGERHWRIRGLDKNLSVSVMKVNLLVSRGDAFHVDTFDLYSARHRQGFVKLAADELSINEDIIKRDVGKVLLRLETLQEEQLHKTLEPQKAQEITLSESEKSAAMDLLTDPNLMDRILVDFKKCGVVGEETNKLVGFLSSVSRKLEKPLAIVIQSSSAAGKSSLMEAILSFLPPEEQVKYSAMTGQSLFYMGETDLKNKILAIVEEEGAEKAAYALKLLQSEGELTIASTGKDPSTGRLETQEYRVEGPVMIFLTTTAIEIDEELQNRCIVLTVDEDRRQTRAIHRQQREQKTLEGLWTRRDRKEILKLHQNAQRLLRPIWVANPFSMHLTFIDDRTRTRRDQEKYLTLIQSIALLHQYQRPVKVSEHKGETAQYIDVTVEDIEIANRLCHVVLGRSLDELAPQTRRLLSLLDKMVTERCAELELERCDYLFTRREVREYTGWSYEQLRVHLNRLVRLEYALVHRGGRGQSFVYELLYDGKGQDGTPFLVGLIDTDDLKKTSTTKSLGGQKDGFGAPLGGHTGPIPGGYRDEAPTVSLNDSAEIKPVNGKTPKITSVDETSGSSNILRQTTFSDQVIEAKGAE